MKTVIQREWRGIARKGPFDKDELTSQMEINTEPGKGELKRLNSRTQYFTNPLPAPAVRFHNQGAYLKTETANGSSFKIFDKATNGIAQQMDICFKFNTFDDILEDFYLVNNSGKFRLWFDKSEEKLRVDIEDDAAGDNNATFYTAWAKDVWYWVSLYTTDGQTMGVKVYLDGSASPALDTSTLIDVGSDFFSSAGSYVTLGAGVSPISIAYFGWDGTASDSITAWTPKLFDTAGNDKLHFLPRDPRKSIFPAQIDSTGATAVKASWCLYPRPGVTFSPAPSGAEEDNVKGLTCSPGRAYKVNMSGLELFERHTVFMFNLERPRDDNTHMTILRSYDSTFAVYLGGRFLAVRWLPETLLDADMKSGYNLYVFDIYDSGSPQLDVNSWFAIEFDPDEKGESEDDPLVSLYQWESTTWTLKSWENSSIWCGHGVTPPSSTEWRLGPVASPVVGDYTDIPDDIYIHDFRVILGDTGWQTTFQPGETRIANIPSELVLWLNHDSNGVWPKDENCQTLDLTTADDVTETVALTDRVTGDYRFELDNYQDDIQWDHCRHLKVCYYPTPEDIKADTSGTVYGPTDSLWYEYGRTATAAGGALVANRNYQRKKTSTVGIHKYITGGGTFQRANVPSKPIAIPNAYVLAGTPTYTTGIVDETTPHGGNLDWDTQYHFKVTFYDPVTGNESNPHGPFYFDTEDYSSGASSG
jgi:hypothetical protein